MISILMVETNPDEARVLEEDIRYLTARCSDEQTKFVALSDIDEISFLHIALVDVTTSGGIEAAKRVRTAFPDVQILVVANMKVSPIRYLTPAIRPSALLLRPWEEAQRRQILEDFFTIAVRPLLHETSGSQFYWVKTRDGTQKIPYTAILYFEAREKKVFVRTRSVEYGMGGTIEKILEKLPENFIRCHRSYIVNKDYIERIRLSEGYVYLAEAVSLPISRSYKAQMKEWSLAGGNT